MRTLTIYKAITFTLFAISGIGQQNEKAIPNSNNREWLEISFEEHSSSNIPGDETTLTATTGVYQPPAAAESEYVVPSVFESLPVIELRKMVKSKFDPRAKVVLEAKLVPMMTKSGKSFAYRVEKVNGPQTKMKVSGEVEQAEIVLGISCINLGGATQFKWLGRNTVKIPSLMGEDLEGSVQTGWYIPLSKPDLTRVAFEVRLSLHQPATLLSPAFSQQIETVYLAF